jgi:hypothetical protein
MPEILRPELIDLTDAEVEAVSGGIIVIPTTPLVAIAGDGGDGGNGSNFTFSLTGVGTGGTGGAGGNATAIDTTPTPI